jgi:uncharacterized protein YgbK (DUF1537 family)
VTTVRVLADDLTGAIDAAAPFACLSGPIPVRWSGDPSSARGSLAFDSETRQSAVVAAAATIRRLAAMLPRSDIAYKVIDCLLRGHPADEIVACLAGGRFASAVVAPAFPAQNQITRRGIQFHRPDANAPWDAVETNLAAALRARGVKTTLVARGAPCGGPGVFLCDAEDNADLSALRETAAEAARPTLWCGTAGLARALAGGSAPVALRFEGPLLTVIGSDHPVSAQQADALAARDRRAVVFLDRPGGEVAAMRTIEQRLERGWDATLVFRLPSMDGMAAQGIMSGLFARLSDSRRPGAALVVGGNTLYRLASGLGAEGLTVQGEVQPGIPCSRIVGGLWANIPVVSKSGAFGGPRILIDVIAELRRRRP